MSDNQAPPLNFIQYSFDFDKIQTIADVIEMLKAIDFRVTVLAKNKEEFLKSNLSKLMKEYHDNSGEA